MKRRLKTSILKEILLNNLAVILILTIIFCMIFGGIGYVYSKIPKTKNLEVASSNLDEKEDTQKSEIAVAKQQFQNALIDQKVAEFELLETEKELQERPILALDSAGLYSSDFRFAIISEDKSDEEITVIKENYIELASSIDFCSKINEKLGTDYFPSAIREIIMVASIKDSNVIRIMVRGDQEKICQELTIFTYDYLTKKVQEKYPDFETEILLDIVEFSSDSYVEKLKLQYNSKLENAKQSVTEKSAKRQELEAVYLAYLKPSSDTTEDVSTRSPKTVVVMFLFVGFILGIIVSYVFFVLKYCLSNKIIAICDIQDNYNIDLLGIIESENRSSLHKKILSQIQTKQPDANLAAANLSLSPNWENLNSILCLSISNIDHCNKISNNLNQLGNDKKFEAAGNVLTDIQAVQKLGQTDAVILIEELASITFDDINNIIHKIEKTNKTILGIILA